jgi:hypothetical protein
VFFPLSVTNFCNNSVNVIVIRMKCIEAKLVSYNHEYRKAAGHAKCKTNDVDDRKDFILSQVSESDG